MAEEVRSTLFKSALPRIALFGAALAALLVVVILYRGGEGDEADASLVCADDAVSEFSPAFARRMPDVALVGMRRAPVMLSELAGERFTVAVFCSYKCPCSDGYVDRLRALRDRYEARGVSFIALQSNADETIDGMVRYIQRKEYPLPVYRDDMAAAADLMHAEVTPEVFVFDSSWMLRYHGRIDDDKSGRNVRDESLRFALDTLLAKGELHTKETMSLGCAIVRKEANS